MSCLTGVIHRQLKKLISSALNPNMEESRGFTLENPRSAFPEQNFAGGASQAPSGFKFR